MIKNVNHVVKENIEMSDGVEEDQGIKVRFRKLDTYKKRRPIKNDVVLIDPETGERCTYNGCISKFDHTHVEAQLPLFGTSGQQQIRFYGQTSKCEECGKIVQTSKDRAASAWNFEDAVIADE